LRGFVKTRQYGASGKAAERQQKSADMSEYLERVSADTGADIRNMALTGENQIQIVPSTFTFVN